MAESSKKITRQLSIFINDREVVNSLGGINKEMAKVNAQLKNLKGGEEDYDKKSKELKDSLEKLKIEQAAWKDEIHGTTEELGAATGAFSNLFSGLKSGDLTKAAAGLTGIKAAILATTKAAFAFIATPIGATIAVLAGIAAVTKAWFDYNNEAAKSNVIFAAITKESGAALDAVRINSKVLAETFNKDAEEIANAAAALVSEFDITYDEAFARIENGFIKGGAAGDEFLESIREYPTFFANAGFSVLEFQNILNTGADLSIYQDKLPDAIKEFGLAVTEQTDAAKDALNNAFGTEFTDKLLKGVKDGSVSVKDALYQVAAEAERIGLNSQQAAQLTADLFKGAGEDAGGANKIFQAVNQSLENMKRPLSEVEQAVKDLTESEKALQQAQDDALKSDGFLRWKTNLLTFFNEVKKGFYDTISVLTNSEEELEKQRNAKDKAAFGQDAVKELEFYLSLRKKRMGEAYDFEEERESHLARLKEQLGHLGNDKEAKKRLQAQIEAVAKYEQKVTKITNDNNLERINAEKKAKEDLEKKAVSDAKAAKKAAAALVIQQATADKKAAEDAAKDYIEKQKAVAKANLDLYIANNQSKINDETRLTQQVIDEEAARLEGIKQAKLQELMVEKGTNELVIALKREQGIALNAQDIEYLTAKRNLEVENVKATEALKKQAKEQDKKLALEQAQIEYELSLANAETTEEEERLRREKAYNDEKSRYKKLLEEKKITASQFTAFIDKLDRDQKAAERSRELARTTENLGALNNLAGAVGTLFGQSKELALAQAAINGAMAITSILAQYPKFDGGFAMAAAIVTAVATTAAQVKQIQKQRAPKRAKFFEGGYTGTDVKYPDEYGGVTQVNEFHGNEWVMPEVMLRQPRYANVAGWLERERKAPGSAGALPGTGAAGDNAGTAVATAALIDVVATLNATLQGGIKATTHVGYKQVRDINKMNEEITASGANGKTNTP
jgi:hypothetical protein